MLLCRVCWNLCRLVLRKNLKNREKPVYRMRTLRAARVVMCAQRLPHRVSERTLLVLVRAIYVCMKSLHVIRMRQLMEYSWIWSIGVSLAICLMILCSEIWLIFAIWNAQWLVVCLSACTNLLKRWSMICVYKTCIVLNVSTATLIKEFVTKINVLSFVSNANTCFQFLSVLLVIRWGKL